MVNVLVNVLVKVLDRHSGREPTTADQDGIYAAAETMVRLRRTWNSIIEYGWKNPRTDELRPVVRRKGILENRLWRQLVALGIHSNEAQLECFDYCWPESFEPEDK